MTIRFFILQSHYRSTLDFSSEALEASEKALKRLWEAYEILQTLKAATDPKAQADTELEAKIIQWVKEFEIFMDDDFSTPRVIANMFEIVPIINSLKEGLIPAGAVSAGTIELMKTQFRLFIEDIMGLQNVSAFTNDTLKRVMNLLIDIRKESKEKRDYATSDKIRNQLSELGILLKDEKDGGMSWTMA
jgi:cysteinyl-tRNA synthetase